MSNHEILVWEIAEAGQGATVSKVVTGWDLRDFKRTDGTPEEQGKRKKARAEAKRRWFDVAGRKGPVAATEEGVTKEAEWIRDTVASILDEFAKRYSVQEVVERRDRRAPEGQGQSAPDQLGPQTRDNQGRAPRPPQSRKGSQEELLGQFPGKCQRRGRLDRGQIHQPQAGW